MINTIEWNKYKIGEIFNSYLSKDDIQSKNIVDGDVPLVSSGKENNGIVAYINDPNSKIWSSNTITVDMFGKAFYQANQYHCVSHGRVNILEPKFNLSSNVLLYIVAVIEKVAAVKYDFDNMCTGKKLLNDEIYLPSFNNQPDWNYMENYMKTIEKNVRTKVLALA